MKTLKKFLLIGLSILMNQGPADGQRHSDQAGEYYSAGINKDFFDTDNNISDSSALNKNHRNFFIGYQQDTTLIKLTTQYLQGVYNKRNPQEIIEIINEILDIEPYSIAFWFNLGEQYFLLFQFDKAIDAYEKNLELIRKAGKKPGIQLYERLGYCYHKYNKYKKEYALYKSGLEEYPGHPSLIGRLAVCNYSMGKMRGMNSLLSQYENIWKNRGKSQSDILYSLGVLFLESDNWKAERYFREALELDTGNVTIKGALARTLVFYNASTKSIQEAMMLLKEVLQAEPFNPLYLHLQGLVFFRQERYIEARDYLERASSLYTEYNHPLQLQLEQVDEILKFRFL